MKGETRSPEVLRGKYISETAQEKRHSGCAAQQTKKSSTQEANGRNVWASDRIGAIRAKQFQFFCCSSRGQVPCERRSMRNGKVCNDNVRQPNRIFIEADGISNYNLSTSHTLIHTHQCLGKHARVCVCVSRLRGMDWRVLPHIRATAFMLCFASDSHQPCAVCVCVRRLEMKCLVINFQMVRTIQRNKSKELCSLRRLVCKAQPLCIEHGG